MTYNSSILEVKNVFEGAYLKETGGSFFNWNVSNGCLTIINYLKQGYANASEGVIATITFKGIYQDYKDRTSLITVKNVELVNIFGEIIELAKSQSASYTIKGLTQIIIRLDREMAYAGSNVTVSGWIIPPNEDVDITIEYRPEHLSSWTPVNVKTDENGNYSFTWEAPSEIKEETVYCFRAFFYIDSLEVVESEQICLTVKKHKLTSSLSIEVLPASIILGGEDVRISGHLEPAVEGANITIQYRLKGESEWKMLAVIKASSKGNFNYIWPAPGIGDYELRAYWHGDEETEASYSNVVTVRIVETMPTGTAGLPFIVVGLVIIAIMFITVYFKGSEHGR